MSGEFDKKEETAYSIIIPFHNEKESVGELLRGVEEAMRGFNEPYEVLAINDGSTDGTLEKIKMAHEENSSIRAVNLPERKGQTACLAEGFRMAKGRIVISMDGDLQDDPGEIPSMLAVFRQSDVDALCGWRRSRKAPASALFLSRMGNFFQSLFLRAPIHDISCTFRIYKREAVKKIELKEEGSHRFIPFLLKKAGFSLAEIEIQNRPRIYGQSKYSSKKALQTMRLFFKILFNIY